MKRKAMDKLIAGVLCAAMVSGLTACGSQGQTDGSSESTKQAESTAASAEKADGTDAEGSREEITLTVMGETDRDGISTDDAIGRYIKDKFGITLEYSSYSNDRMQLMASGGDLPDIVYVHNDAVSIDTLIDSGVLWCMDDWLENNGDNLKKYIPEAMKFSKEVVGGGKTYFIPTSVQYANPDNPSRNGFVGFYTRWDYYKELGYPEINNEDDYLNVLKQMQDAHPTNSEGKKVYALSAWTDWGLWPYMISYPFSHGYMNIDYNQLSNEVTGEIEDMFTLEDGIFWQAMAFFNKAYQMGIMDPEAFTMKCDQYNQKIKDGSVLVCAYNWTQPDTSICGEDAASYIIPGAFPYIAQAYPIDNPIGYCRANVFAISANCKYPERVMELMDYFTSDEGLRLILSGIKGEDWDVVDGRAQLIGKRLENVKSGDTAYPSYNSEQGVDRYYWFATRMGNSFCADGEPGNLKESKAFILENISDADKDFCDYYTDGKAQYPGEAYVELINEGKMKMVDGTNLAPKVMDALSDESSRILSKASEYFQANVAKIITSADDEAFAEQKAKVISDINAMGYQDALKEVQVNYEKAQETVKIFE